MPIRSAPYRIDRWTLARIALGMYLRLFWWWVLPPPLFGLFALLFGTGFLQVIGVMGLLWPLTLPSRAMLASTRAGRVFRHEVTLIADERGVAFASEGGGVRLDWPQIRQVVRRGPYAVLLTRRLGIVAAPVAALPTGGLDFLQKRAGVHK